MTTFEHMRVHAAGLPVRVSVLGRVVTLAGPAWGILRPLLMTLVALGCFIAAAFTWHLWAGLVVAGLSALVVDFKIDMDSARRNAGR